MNKRVDRESITLPLILNAKTRSISARARAEDREDVIHGAEQLGLPLDTVIAEVITALKLDAERIGLAGTAHSTPPEIERGSARLRV